MDKRKENKKIYDAVIATGKVSETRCRVLQYLWRSAPCTGAELWKQMQVEFPNIVKGSICSRLGELRDMGILTERGQRACGITGAVAAVWDFTGNTEVTPYKKKESNERLYRRLLQWAVSNVERQIAKGVVLKGKSKEWYEQASAAIR